MMYVKWKWLKVVIIKKMLKWKKIKNVELILNFKLVILIVIFVWLDSEILWELCRYCEDEVNECILFLRFEFKEWKD